MAIGIREVNNSIIFENDCVEFTVSKKTAVAEKIVFKKTKKDIKKQEVPFFAMMNEEGENYKLNSLSISGDVITVDTEIGKMDIEVKAFPRYFTLELLTSLPEKCHTAMMGHAFYELDESDNENPVATALAMTYWSNIVHSPNIQQKETLCKIVRHLRDKNAKIALMVTSIKDQRDVLKEATLAVDKNVGIRSTVGGAFALDSRINYGNYIIQYQSAPKFFKERLPFYKEIGVDHIDYHHNEHETMGTFRQGDFKFCGYKDAAEFKKNVSDVLEENGMLAGLHTYAHFLSSSCTSVLCDTKFHKDLKIKDTFTLKEDLNKDSEYVEVVEDITDIKTSESFYSEDSTYLLIDEEIIHIEKADKGFKILERAASGTKISNHKKNTEIKRIYRFFWCFYPLLGSPLFFEIARNTAKAYNEGGFKMIYLDAIDCMFSKAKREEAWYYVGEFVCEIMKNCKVDPILEGSAGSCTIWAAGGRRGAWDSPCRAYKNFNRYHMRFTENVLKSHSTATMGWYNFYPENETMPGNYLSKYQHTEDIHDMGSIAVKNDFSISFNGPDPHVYATSKGLQRNIGLYRKYDDLRKAQYFSEEYREKLRNGKWEYHLKEKRGGKFVFVEKDYQKKKIYDLNSNLWNTPAFKNPFGQQTPFVRIEASLSSKGENPMLLLPLDEKRDITEQTLKIKYPANLNLKKHFALKVRICGNNTENSAVCIKVRGVGRHDVLMYVIETNFKGWRDFFLIETDNGDFQRKYPFDITNEGYHWAAFGAGFHHDQVQIVEVQTEGDMTGVKMSSIYACEHSYDVLKNPTVKIGESEVKFNCELKSTDFIEFDGKKAKIIDRYANETDIGFVSTLKAPRGKFKAEITAESTNNLTPRAILTLGFTGKELK